MTTKGSPIQDLKSQANKIAKILKAAERGEKINAQFAEKIAASRLKEEIKVGIVMDDKVITIDIPWTTIKNTTEWGLSKYIIGLMQESKDET